MSHEIDRMTYIPIKIDDTPYLAITEMERLLYWGLYHQCLCRNRHVWLLCNGPLVRYVILRVAHALGMLVTFSPPLRVSNPDMHRGTCMTHVPWCMPGSLTSGFLRSRWGGKRSPHSRCMRNLQFYVTGKRPMETYSSNTAITFGNFYLNAWWKVSKSARAIAPVGSYVSCPPYWTYHQTSNISCTKSKN